MLRPALAVLAAAALGASALALAQAPKPPAPPPAATTGSIKGTVIFEGEAPDRKPLLRDSE